ncbi:(pine wood nematode) hypothetical protein [Aphelenchoides bicaudatus]|nr:(pine wood nematode) hypothetical protein [Aphelenchoides bicaudatus]
MNCLNENKMFILLLVSLLIAFLVHQFWYRRLNLPKGPLPWPLFGNIGTLLPLNRWEDKFLEWKNEYGSVYTYWLGPQPIIAVNTYEKAVELFVKNGDSVADRSPFIYYQKVLNGGCYGIFDTNGSLWQEQRRLTIRILRDFGLGKNKMQERILEEVESMFSNLNSDIKMGIKEHDFYTHTDIAVGSETNKLCLVINAVLTGFRFTMNGNEAKFYKLKQLSTDATNLFADPMLLIALTSEFFAKLPIISSKFNHFIGLMREIFVFLDQAVDHHKEQLEGQDFESVEPRDFIDAYLIEWKKAEKSGQTHYFSDVQLRNVLSDMFAGQETTSTTLTWIIAYLIKNQDVQAKLHEELDKVIGNDRLITVADRSNLPYTNAVIMEGQRCGNIVSQNFYRRIDRDIEVDGTLIQKGSLVIPQISVMHIDPNNFSNPQEFNPSRFIDKNGQLKRCDELVPFSLGKRVWSFTAGKKPPTLKKDGGGSGFSTEAYKCRIEPRY